MSITSITPLPIQPNVVTSIRGSGFTSNLTHLQVLVGGVPATILSATSTTVTFMVPAGPLACRLNKSTQVRVWNSGSTASQTVELQTATLRDLRVSESTAPLEGVQAWCNQVPTDGRRYLVAVLNTSTAPHGSTSFELRGETQGAPVGPNTPHIAFQDSLSSAITGVFALSDQQQEGGDGRADHADILQSGADFVRVTGLPLFTREAQLANARIGRLRGALKVGDLVTMRIGKSADELCSGYSEVSARVVYVGEHAMILEDVDAPLASKMDAAYRSLGTEFDQTMWNILVRNFGDPLAYDDHLDNDGRMRMLFTRKVRNIHSNVLGFMSPCDFYPRSDAAASKKIGAPASNQDEVFYADVPDSMSEVAGWVRENRPTLIHETKHIVAYAVRFAASSKSSSTVHPEESWLEEGLAEHAEELYARLFSGARWRGETGYATGVRCDFHEGENACSSRPKAMSYPFYFLYEYLDRMETESLLGQESQDARRANSFYGSSWWFLRWLVDRYAGPAPEDESVLLRRLTRGTDTSAAVELEQITGHSYPELLCNWALANGAAALGLPLRGMDVTKNLSWNLSDVFAGLHAESADDYPKTAPLVPHHEVYGAINDMIPQLQASTSALFELSGPNSGPQLLNLRSELGQDPSASVRLCMARVE